MHKRLAACAHAESTHRLQAEASGPNQIAGEILTTLALLEALLAMSFHIGPLQASPGAQDMVDSHVSPAKGVPSPAPPCVRLTRLAEPWLPKSATMCHRTRAVTMWATQVP